MSISKDILARGVHHVPGKSRKGNGKNTFVGTYRKLKEFEDDLHKPVHLENNILFLKAAQLLMVAWAPDTIKPKGERP